MTEFWGFSVVDAQSTVDGVHIKKYDNFVSLIPSCYGVTLALVLDLNHAAQSLLNIVITMHILSLHTKASHADKDKK